MNDTNVFLNHKLQTQKLKEKWSTKGSRLNGIEKIAMSFTLQISPIWSTKTFLNPLVWRVRKRQKETLCFLHVQGLTKYQSWQTRGKCESPCTFSTLFLCLIESVTVQQKMWAFPFDLWVFLQTGLRGLSFPFQKGQDHCAHMTFKQRCKPITSSFLEDLFW
jgi:hypothetical protein